MQKYATHFFAAILFISAALLFQIQLIYAKLLTPHLGGAPSVWVTAMVFFQTALLIGYAYAFSVSKCIAPRKQILLHSVLLLLAVMFIPQGVIGTEWVQAVDRPVQTILSVLILQVGLCFFILSTTTPLMQSWFGLVSPAHKNPYIFYAASNLGSFGGLLTYPFIVEPYIDIAGQMALWRGMFLVYAMLVLCGGIAVIRSGARLAAEKIDTAPVPVAQKWRWFLYAFIPVSLMLSVTTYVSSDVAAVPLVWVLILSIYLLTFVLVFSGKIKLNEKQMVEGLAYCILMMLVLRFWSILAESWMEVAFHLLVFFAASMVFHMQLAKLKPDAKSAPEYYMYIALGGAVASIVNGVVAPLMFHGVYEYNIGIFLAALFMPVAGYVLPGFSKLKHDIALPVLLGGGFWAVLFLCYKFFAPAASLKANIIEFIIGAGFVWILAAWRDIPPRFAIGVLAMMIVGWTAFSNNTPVVFSDRSFFGTIKVVEETSGRHILIHGTTMHGAQWVGTDQELWPQTYYTREGPLGDLFGIFDKINPGAPIGAAGLGVGSTACYAKQGQKITYFEIDRKVEAVARNPEYFTYLSKCPADVVIGDARIELAAQPDGKFGFLILDTFSSDSVPVHMLTKQAMATYKQKISENGIIAVHVSSRYFNLAPVVASIAKANGLHVAAKIQTTDTISGGQVKSKDWSPSFWVAVAANPEIIKQISAMPGWTEPKTKPNSLWTDDYSSIWAALKTDLFL